VSFCNPFETARRGEGAAARARDVAWRMLWVVTMKDLVFIGITVAFFTVGWLYARSFDRL